MAGSTVPLAFAVISFTLAYLAVNTTDKYASLQLGNYILTYFAMVFTGFLSFSYAASNESPAKVLTGWNNTFYFVAILVVAVFLIRILNNILESIGKEVL